MMMTGLFARRRVVKVAREWLQHARLCRLMREDIVSGETIEALQAAEERLRDAMEYRDTANIEKECIAVKEASLTVMPTRPMAGLRENLEVIVVALVVAMAFRCYFFQPFKIPTGSMQPSLFGIHYIPHLSPSLFDKYPLRWLKWVAFGEWCVEIKTETGGRVRGPYDERKGDGMLYYDIGGRIHRIPREMVDKSMVLIKAGDEVVTGQIIARGIRITGDHLFVNRIKWNFLTPQRGEVMVFRTAGIPYYPGLAPDTHYIKRMCGLPRERISIRAPKLIVDGKEVVSPESIVRIEREALGYSGYHPATGVGQKAYIPDQDTEVTLGADEYLALGDNTQNSLDGRYWGPVPQANLVGPACIVYWPLSCRTGFVW